MISFGDMKYSNPVADAWVGGDLEKMLSVVHLTDCPPVDRHFLLLSIVEQAKKRYHRDPIPKKRDLVMLYCEQHLEEFPRLCGPLLQSTEIGDSDDEDYCPPETELPNVPTFDIYATLLFEAGRRAEALQVCADARRYPFGEDQFKSIAAVLDRFPP